MYKITRNGNKQFDGTVSPGRLTIIIFSILVVIVCSDLNNLFSNIFDTAAFFSIPILILTCILLIRTLKFEKSDLLNRNVLIFFFVYGWLLVYGAFINILTDFNNQNTALRWRYYLPAILIAYVTFRISDILIKNGKLYFLLKLYALSFFINSVIISAGALFNIDILSLNTTEVGTVSRASGLIDNVNQAGQIAAFAQIFLLSSALSPKSNIKWYFYLIGYIICLTAGFVTFSKASFFYILFIIFFFMVFILRGANGLELSKFKVYKIIGSALILLLIFFYSYERISNNFNSEQQKRLTQFSQIIKGELNKETTSNRSLIAETAFNYIKTDPIVGHGLGTFHSLPRIRWGTHNEYLLLWGEVGLVGIILYIGLYLSFWLTSRNIDSPSIKFLVRGVTLLLFSASFVTHNVLSTKFTMITFGLILGVLVNINKINQESNHKTTYTL